MLETAKIVIPQRCANILGREQTERESTMSDYRTCQTCGQNKSIFDFTFQNRAENKRKYICGPCDKARQLDYYYRNKSSLLRKKQIKYEENRSKFLEKRSLYRKAHPEKVKKSFDAWVEKNPDALRINAKQRKARMRGAGIKKISRREIALLLMKPCFYCGNTENIQLDHVVPIARGGIHSIGNLLPACRSCNASKNKWFITEWKALKSKNAIR
jgi:5-methylcytosine-specific restriction endonuclease McrA